MREVNWSNLCASFTINTSTPQGARHKIAYVIAFFLLDNISLLLLIVFFFPVFLFCIDISLMLLPVVLLKIRLLVEYVIILGEKLIKRQINHPYCIKARLKCVHCLKQVYITLALS